MSGCLGARAGTHNTRWDPQSTIHNANRNPHWDPHSTFHTGSHKSRWGLQSMVGPSIHSGFIFLAQYSLLYEMVANAGLLVLGLVAAYVVYRMGKMGGKGGQTARNRGRRVGRRWRRRWKRWGRSAMYWWRAMAGGALGGTGQDSEELVVRSGIEESWRGGRRLTGAQPQAPHMVDRSGCTHRKAGGRSGSEGRSKPLRRYLYRSAWKGVVGVKTGLRKLKAKRRSDGLRHARGVAEAAARITHLENSSSSPTTGEGRRWAAAMLFPLGALALMREGCWGWKGEVKVDIGLKAGRLGGAQLGGPALAHIGTGGGFRGMRLGEASHPGPYMEGGASSSGGLEHGIVRGMELGHVDGGVGDLQLVELDYWKKAKNAGEQLRMMKKAGAGQAARERGDKAEAADQKKDDKSESGKRKRRITFDHPDEEDPFDRLEVNLEQREREGGGAGGQSGVGQSGQGGPKGN